jgi:hypothetical protein
MREIIEAPQSFAESLKIDAAACPLSCEGYVCRWSEHVAPNFDHLVPLLFSFQSLAGPKPFLK